MSHKIHRSHERGTAEHGWLHSRFSFSFADYHNRDRMGFGALRVINDDVIEPGKGFGMHPHRNMEIVSVVLKGALEHRDSFGNHDVIKAGEIQYMSAGSGVQHSEFNPSDGERVELFQVWILPHGKDGAPVYDKRDFTRHDHENRWVTLVSGTGEDGAMPIRQDAKIRTTSLQAGRSIETGPGRDGHGRLLFVVEGRVEVCGETLGKRDEIQITDDQNCTITATEASRLMLFEVPMNP